MTPDGAPEQAEAEAERRQPTLEPRTRALLRAVANLLRSVSPEDGETDILLHDMARQIEARLASAAGSGAGAEEPPQADRSQAASPP